VTNSRLRFNQIFHPRVLMIGRG